MSTPPAHPSHVPNEPRGKINIATLHPAKDPDSEVVCTLSRTWLDENTTPYEAVSYAWDEKKVKILLNDNPFQDEEKLAQELPRIRLAFEHAQQTIIWLGSASDDSDLAMDHLAYLASRQRKKDAEGFLDSCWNVLTSVTTGVLFIALRSLRYGFEILSYVLTSITGFTHILGSKHFADRKIRGVSGWVTYPLELLVFLLIAIPVCGACIIKEMAIPPPSVEFDPGTEVILALSRFFERRWFSRIWMVEEVIIAKRAMVICGSRTFSWSCLTDACYMMDSIVCSETGPSPYINCLYHRVDAFASVMELNDLHPSILLQRSSLLYLITVFSHLDAFKSRDKIKALLGLSADKEILFARDVKSAPVMFAATVKYIIESSNNLDVLRACLFKGTVQDLPSWVPDWTVKNIRSVSGMTYHMEPWHLESGEYSSENSPIAIFSPDLRCMTVKGIVVARLKSIESVWSYSRSGSFIQHPERYKKVIAYLTNGSVTDGRIVLASTNKTRIFPLLSGRSINLFVMALQFVWLIPGISKLVNLATNRNLGGFGFAFRTWNTVLSEPAQSMNRGRPGKWSLTWEAIASKLNPEGYDATTTTVWYTEALKNGVPVKPSENQLKYLETYTEGGEPDDLVVMLIGAKLPFIVRPINEPIQTTHDGAVTGATTPSFRLIGPAGFAGFTGNTILWNRTKKLYMEGKHTLETFKLV